MTPRDLQFSSELQIVDDVQRLRRGWTTTGKWTLAQACWHMVGPLEVCLHQPTQLELNDSQKKLRPFLEQTLAAKSMPAGLPIAPGSDPLTDAKDVGDETIDRFIAALRQLARYGNSHVDFGPFGATVADEFRRFIFVHIAHHLAVFHPKVIDRRTTARPANEDAMVAEIARLRRGYTMGGNWSLPQICWHLNLGIAMPLVEVPAQEELTEAQITRQARWDHYIAHGYAPAGFEAPQEMVPPLTCSEADVDAFIALLHALKAFKGKFIRAAAGVMPIERARGFILAHGWRHLSCLHPVHRRREALSFASEAGVIADIERLRRGFVAAGNWSLEQVCWHLAKTIPIRPSAGDASVPLNADEQKMQEVMDGMIRAGGPPPGFESPAQIVPPANCEASAIDDLVKRLEAFGKFDAPFVQLHGFGAVPTVKARQMILGHSARHLAFLRPIVGPREGLRFDNEDAAIADIERLRRGYEQVGGWSLPQVCWHLHATMQARLQPGPHAPNTPEQDARKPIFDKILATGELPKGIQAPEHVSPPADVGDEAIDACLATLLKMRDHAEPFAPHRLFGNAPAEVARKQNLIHVAHHLSHLVPSPSTDATKQTSKQ